MDDNTKNELKGFIDNLKNVLIKELAYYDEVKKLEEEKKEKIATTTFYDITTIGEKLEKVVELALRCESQRQVLCNNICNIVNLPHQTSFKKIVAQIPEEWQIELNMYHKKLISTLERIQFLNETNSAIILDNLKLINYTLNMMTGEQEMSADYGDSIMNKYNPKPVIISTIV